MLTIFIPIALAGLSSHRSCPSKELLHDQFNQPLHLVESVGQQSEIISNALFVVGQELKDGLCPSDLST